MMTRSSKTRFAPIRRAGTLAAVAATLAVGLFGTPVQAATATTALTAVRTVAADAVAPRAAMEVAQAFASAFNARDLEALMALYPAGSVFVPAPGQGLASADAVRQALQGFLAIGLPITLSVRHGYEAGDIALLVVDWSIRGTGADGRPINLAGTGTDVVRRGADGRWRYLVDNPFGGAKSAP
ncbi:MAG: YybH family protein [Betaproteobacteria bacterium]|jgi:ketosteroid isomerase-like protein